MEIYKIAEQYRELKNLLNSDDGEGLQEATQEAFFELMQDQANGAEIAVKLIREAEALNVAATIELDRIKSLIEARKSRIERAKSAVMRSMSATNTKSIETTLGKFSLREGSERTIVNDETALFELAMSDEKIADSVKVELVKKPVLAEIKRLIKEKLIPENIASIVRGEKTLTLK